MCRNWKSWAVLGALVAGIVTFTAVTFSALLPLLVLAACPAMMVVAGGIFHRGFRDTQEADHESSSPPKEDVAREHRERVVDRDPMEATR